MKGECSVLENIQPFWSLEKKENWSQPLDCHVVCVMWCLRFCSLSSLTQQWNIQWTFIGQDFARVYKNFLEKRLALLNKKTLSLLLSFQSWKCMAAYIKNNSFVLFYLHYYIQLTLHQHIISFSNVAKYDRKTFSTVNQTEEFLENFHIKLLIVIQNVSKYCPLRHLMLLQILLNI